MVLWEIKNLESESEINVSSVILKGYCTNIGEYWHKQNVIFHKLWGSIFIDICVIWLLLYIITLNINIDQR
jgi:hypothetical protein